MAVSHLPWRILVHTATPLEYDEGAGAIVEGERGGAPAPAERRSFPCLLFLPTASGQQPQVDQFRMRVVTEPTLMYNVTRQDGSVVELDLESEVLVLAPELAPFTGAERARWQLVGAPVGFGPPGRVIGAQATLSMVRG